MPWQRVPRRSPGSGRDSCAQAHARVLPRRTGGVFRRETPEPLPSPAGAGQRTGSAESRAQLTAHRPSSARAQETTSLHDSMRPELRPGRCTAPARRSTRHLADWRVDSSATGPGLSGAGSCRDADGNHVQVGHLTSAHPAVFRRETPPANTRSAETVQVHGHSQRQASTRALRSATAGCSVCGTTRS